jgi:hypothetical protein
MLDLLGHAAVLEDRFGGHRQLDLLQEEVDAPSRPLSSLRDILIGLPVSARHDRGQRLEVAHHAGAEALDAGLALGHRRGAQAGWAARAAAALAATDAASSAGRVVMSWPVAGLWMASVGHGRVAFAARGVQKVVAGWGRRRSACRVRACGIRDATARQPPRAGRCRRIASIMPSSGQRASTTKAGARSLMPWWCTLLIV